VAARARMAEPPLERYVAPGRRNAVIGNPMPFRSAGADLGAACKIAIRLALQGLRRPLPGSAPAGRMLSCQHVVHSRTDRLRHRVDPLCWCRDRWRIDVRRVITAPARTSSQRRQNRRQDPTKADFHSVNSIDLCEECIRFARRRSAATGFISRIAYQRRSALLPYNAVKNRKPSRPLAIPWRAMR
jgi:hypothetical protein